MIFSAPIQYVITSYFRLVGIFLSLLLVGLQKKKDIHELIIYSIVVCFFFLWPMWILRFLLKNYESLRDKDFFQKFSSLYNDIKVSSTAALAYKAIYAVRRFDLIVFNLVLTAESPISRLERNHFLEKIVLFLMI